ncbi:hypothetical protein B0H63DRAFT_490430 [Podospora didyma]|uniref:Uncharacterized protein n=1 Tax=Podospora didyma TaxID=330526 RepID=A0AAE0N1Y7_9PEZI|nr:hypothetical protein B0H63DRAFT_490430 [Podospora didyma]
MSRNGESRGLSSLGRGVGRSITSQSKKAASEEANAKSKVEQKVRDFISDGCKKNGGLGTSEEQFVKIFIRNVLDNLGIPAPLAAAGPWVTRLNKLNEKNDEIKQEKTFFLKLANAYILAKGEPCKTTEALKDKKIQQWETRLTYPSTHESGIGEGLQEKIDTLKKSWDRALQDHKRLKAACGTPEAACKIPLGSATREELAIITRSYLISLKDVVNRAENEKVKTYIPEVDAPAMIKVCLFNSWTIKRRRLNCLWNGYGSLEPNI